MKPLIYFAILLALPLWGCADDDGTDQPDDDAAADAAPADNDAGDEGGDDAATGDDGGVQDAAATADAGADASPGADASTPADSGVGGDAAPAADAGANVDSGADAGPQPTVIWSKRNQATTNLGATGSQPYHQARFGWGSASGCTLAVDSPFYPTDHTGSAIVTLTSAQQACMRLQFDCSVRAQVSWGHCAMAGCPALQPGVVWQTDRPACAVTIPAGKALMLRHTVAALGAGGIDETWELVTP